MIPDFDHNLVLPPHKGNPALPTDLSPYNCSTKDLCNKFATSPERIEILKNYLTFRENLNTYGLLNGLQWLDGSFLEDIEAQEKRSPRDLDLVTIYWGYDIPFQTALVTSLPEFADPVLSKARFKLDHYPFDACFSPLNTLDMARYWAQLFSHNRNSVWKGMLAINLNTPVEDSEALVYLQSL